MCGIAGILVGDEPLLSSDELLAAARAMGNALRHRGPDDSGEFVSAPDGLALSHRRLSILDLSSSGHQPMDSASGRLVISFNGEIYNFRVLQSELGSRGHSFRGGSDTEVLLAALEEWGIEEALKRLVGMFAFALWDRRDKTLTLARDRLGEKPLFYGWNSGRFLFASELKAMKAFRGFQPEVNRSALALYLRHNYVPAPHSIYNNIFKLQPGSFLSLKGVSFGAPPESFSPLAGSAGKACPQLYWDPRHTIELPPVREQGAIELLENRLSEAVRGQMISDVPLGAFLSGGIDSSLIVSLMRKESSKVRTFSIGFSESEYNEAHHALKVAKHLGTEHTELYVTPHDALSVIPRLPRVYDEPFGDSSQIPTLLVSELARRHVTVSLSGDGGDELFCGYERYAWAHDFWRFFGVLPPILRRSIASLLRIPGVKNWSKLFDLVGNGLFSKWRILHPAEKVMRLAAMLDAKSRESFYQMMVSQWEMPNALVVGAEEAPSLFSLPERWPRTRDYLSQMMYFDLSTYLPDDILVKVDRASMDASLEARAPFLDHRVVELALALPTSLKMRDGKSKWILRQILSKYVPNELTDRPKMGFGVPIDSWLRTELREWAEELLSEERLRREGYLRPEEIRRRWVEHRDGVRNWHHHLWTVLMFQAWLENQR